MKKLILVILTLFLANNINAQLLDSIYKYQKKGLSFNHQSLDQYRYYNILYMKSNNIPPPPHRDNSIEHFKKEENLNGIFFSYRHNTTKKWGGYFRFDHRRFSDYFTSVYLLHFAHDSFAGSRSSFADIGIITTSYFGEYNYGRNVIVNPSKSLVVSAGAYLSDVKLPQSYYGIGGTHIVGGGFINMDWVIGKNLVWRVSPAYAREFAYIKYSMKGIDRFGIVKVETELVHRNGWYFGYEHMRYDRASERRSLKIGHRFNKIGRKAS